MKFSVAPRFPADTEAIVVRLLEDQKPSFPELAPDLAKAVVTDLKKDDFKGKIGEAYYYKSTLGRGPKAVIVAGMGQDCTPESSRRAAAEAIKRARGAGLRKIATGTGGKLTFEDIGRFNTVGALLADYVYDKYQKPEKPRPEITYTFVCAKPRDAAALKKGMAQGRAAAEAAMLARDLVNEPASSLTPTALANVAKRVARDKGLKVRTWNKAEIKKIPMEAFLSVAKGSDEPPVLMRLDYNPPRAKKHVVLVGKGVTYDSGGINIKPSRGGGLEDMKMDMAGAAAVIGAVSALPALKLPVRVTAYVAATENMTGGAASKPGDVVRAYNGKTIEILNTDAEGRLTLADVLSYSEKKDKPDVILDLATLTATEISLGLDYAAVFGDKEVLEALQEAGEYSGEKVWPFPLPDEYQDTVKGRIADLRNTGTDRGYSINGAVFLRNFVTEKTPWAHIDIGSPAGSEVDRGYLKKGGTGFGVRLLLAYLIQMS